MKISSFQFCSILNEHDIQTVNEWTFIGLIVEIQPGLDQMLLLTDWGYKSIYHIIIR